MNKCPILAGQHVCVKWEWLLDATECRKRFLFEMLHGSKNDDSSPQKRTGLVKRSIKFGLARFPLNRSVSQRRVRLYQEKEKRVGTGRAMPWPGLHAAFLFLALFLWCHVMSVESECCTDVA